MPGDPGARPGQRDPARMFALRRQPWMTRVVIAALVACASLGTSLTATSAGDLQNQIGTSQSAASALRSEIAADSKYIAATSGGLQQARDRLSAIQSDLDRRVAQLRTVQSALLSARARLISLENHLHLASGALAANLVASYETGKPDLMSVVLEAHGFGDLLERVGFMARLAHQDAHVVGVTRAVRAEVSSQATRLGTLETRDRALAVQILARRNSAAALQSALLREQLRQLSVRSHASARYQALSSRIKTLEKRASEQATRAAQTGNANVAGIPVNTSGMVQPPPGAPAAIAQVIAAGNAIATLPYIYGGGHASFHANGYDCSGSVSYALAAAGLVQSPMVSGDFETWGAPGPGRWITVYANAGHVWMTVAGWRFDTVALADSGTRWARGGGEFSGFVVRHPAGL